MLKSALFKSSTQSKNMRASSLISRTTLIFNHTIEWLETHSDNKKIIQESLKDRDSNQRLLYDVDKVFENQRYDSVFKSVEPDVSEISDCESDLNITL